MITVELISDPELGGCTARLPDLPAYGEGETEDEAIADLKVAVHGSIDALGLEDALSRINAPLAVRQLAGSLSELIRWLISHDHAARTCSILRDPHQHLSRRKRIQENRFMASKDQNDVENPELTAEERMALAIFERVQKAEAAQKVDPTKSGKPPTDDGFQAIFDHS